MPSRTAYDGLAQQIAKVEEGSGQTYYVVLLRSAGAGTDATKNYADRLFENWIATARAKNLPFEPGRAVLVVISLEDRRIAVHAGADLQNRFGLEGPTIKHQLIRPGFVPQARAGNYPEAIVSLVRSVESWVADRDPETATRLAQLEQRRAQLKDDARAAVESGQRLLDEARQERDEKREGGLDVQDATQTIDAASARLEVLPPRIDREAGAVLTEASDIQHDLERTIASLRQRAAQQVEAAWRSRVCPPCSTRPARTCSELRSRSDRSARSRRNWARSRQGLRKLAACSAAILRRPSRSRERWQARSRAPETALEALPALEQQQKVSMARIDPLEKQVAAALDDAENSGTDVDFLRNRFKQTQAAVAAARQDDPGDLGQAVAVLESAQTQYRTDLEEIQAAKSRHRFYSRFLPLTLIGLVVAVGGLLFGLVRVLHVQARNSADTKLKNYREQATKMMERLDALKERHKMLPVIDGDFQEPMAGATLELYQSVEDRSRQLWDRWLQIMERLDQAQLCAGNSRAWASPGSRRPRNCSAGPAPSRRTRNSRRSSTPISTISIGRTKRLRRVWRPGRRSRPG